MRSYSCPSATISPSPLRYIPSFARSFSLFLFLSFPISLFLRRGARARYMGGKKRPESIRSARKDGICVSAVGDQRIGSSRSAGVSLGHARSESHSSGAGCPARPRIPPLPGPPPFVFLSSQPFSPIFVAVACIAGRYSSLESGPCLAVSFIERVPMGSL